MDENVIWESEKGTFVVVIVRPNSKDKKLIRSFSETEVVVNLQSPAREGKANKEILKRFSKELGLSSSDIVIAAGHKSRKKTLLLNNISAESLYEELEKLHNL